MDDRLYIYDLICPESLKLGPFQYEFHGTPLYTTIFVYPPITINTFDVDMRNPNAYIEVSGHEV